MTALSYHPRPDGLRLAYRHRPGRGPTIVFLPGYMSDMDGGKASALDGWAAESGRAMLRLDYSGCGQSEGRFDSGTLTIWRDDVLCLIDALTEGPLILVGSSMGGWLMLLVALARPDRVAALVGIASAPDFTEWGFDDAKRAILVTEGRIVGPETPGERPYLVTRDFWQSGQENLLLGAPIEFGGPVRLLHGTEDEVVPCAISQRLAACLTSPDIAVELVPGGDHRLSREADIARLIAVVAELAPESA